MSSSNRTTQKGGKGAKGDKAHKLDKSDTGRGAGDKLQGNDSVRSKSDDPHIKEKVKQVIEMTQRDENEVCLVLYECEYDVELAVNRLFESEEKGTWETTVKKKKSRQPSQSKGESTEAQPGDDWNETQPNTEEKSKSRNKSGGPPRLTGRHNDNRGWRGREKQQNEKNTEDSERSDFRDRRGRPGGNTRGGGGGRGRGGGRAGGRYPPRGNRGSFNSRPIETWDNSNTWDNSTANTTNHTAEENWDDFPGTDEWSTEEYTGSLADTKVFTPSVQSEAVLDSSVDPSIASTVPVEPANLSQTLEIRSQMPSQNPVPMVGTLNAAQTQYLNQLTQQTSENLKAQFGRSTGQAFNAGSGYGTNQSQSFDKTSQVFSNNTANVSQYNSTVQQYSSTPSSTYGNSNYGVSGNYGNIPDQTTTQPVRTKTQRARVPPPSKIPSSAVEMPGDLNSSIGYLDVQFGALDIMLDGNTFDADTKFGATNSTNLDNTTTVPSSTLDLNSSTQQNSALDPYSSTKPTTQSSISSAISQGLPNTDSIPQAGEHLSAYSAATSRTATNVSSTAQSVTPSPLDLNKPTDPHSYSNQSSYNSYQPKSSSFQSQTYSSSSYSGTQVTSSSYVSNPPSNTYTNSNSGTYNPPSAGNSYPNAYSSTSSYQSNSSVATFPSISQANSYPTNNQTYQQNTSQSVYGANTGLNSSSSYSNTSGGASQYSNYNSGSNHKLGKDSSGYESGSAVVSSATATTSASSSALSTTAGSKTTTTSAKNSSNMVSNIPPGVTPVMSTTPYMIGQVPFFQPQMYATYDDMHQLLQQRIPHVTTPYYDMNMSYQTPTTLTTARDGALANVAYSISDGRFTRGDNNASPVPSTLSQQTSTLTQGHQAQPILAQTAAHPGWIYPSTYNPMTPSYPFSVMYPQQLPAATNAHGSTNSTQYPKQATYGSAYNSGYETLTQSQDYVGNTQGQSKGTGANVSSTGSAGNDLSAMYGKSHVALGKVNSYEKQGFHSGTPPPFTGALHGGQSAGLAPSATGYGHQMYIPAVAPHQQHHSAPLMHQPLHQMEVRHQGRRMDSGSAGGQRSQATTQNKSAAKQGYPASYWNQA